MSNFSLLNKKYYGHRGVKKDGKWQDPQKLGVIHDTDDVIELINKISEKKKYYVSNGKQIIPSDGWFENRETNKIRKTNGRKIQKSRLTFSINKNVGQLDKIIINILMTCMFSDTAENHKFIECIEVYGNDESNNLVHIRLWYYKDKLMNIHDIIESVLDCKEINPNLYVEKTLYNMRIDNQS